MENEITNPAGAQAPAEPKCPVSGGARRHTTAGGPTNANWWPNQLNLKILHQHSPVSHPMDNEFNYAEEFKKLDLDAVTGAPCLDDGTQAPPDYGHYGPLFIRGVA